MKHKYWEYSDLMKSSSANFPSVSNWDFQGVNFKWPNFTYIFNNKIYVLEMRGSPPNENFYWLKSSSDGVNFIKEDSGSMWNRYTDPFNVVVDENIVYIAIKNELQSSSDGINFSKISDLSSDGYDYFSKINYKHENLYYSFISTNKYVTSKNLIDWSTEIEIANIPGSLKSYSVAKYEGAPHLINNKFHLLALSDSGDDKTLIYVE